MTHLDNIPWEYVPKLAVHFFQNNEPELTQFGWRAPCLEKLATGVVGPAIYHQFKDGVPNLPGPLLISLLGGMGVGGAGYLLGTGLENLMPQNWERKKLRRTLGLGGMMLGAAPGLIYGLSNMSAGRPFNANILKSRPFKIDPPVPYKAPADWKMKQPGIQDLPATSIDKEVVAAFEKVCQNESATGLGSFRPIEVNEFNQVIWRDPRVAAPLSPAMQAAATGAVTSAAYLPGKTDHNWVTPMDMGRLAVGMGGGYLSGAIAGSVLGALVGLPRETQDRLKQTGMWAGAVKSVIPRLFGGY